MSTLLPLDDDHRVIPALRLKPGGAHALPAGAASVRNAQPFAPDTRIIGVYATGPVYVRTGNATVTATATAADHYFPEGVYYDLSMGDDRQGRHTHIAVLRAGTADCTLYLSEKE
jgi:hypothetical protein